MVRRTAPAVALAVLAAPLAARASGPDQAAADAAAMQAVCGRCHNLQLVESQARPEQEWMAILQKMADLGANGTDQQFDGVVRYVRAHLTLVNVNTASVSQLVRILGISRPMAEAVVARREQRTFADVADLASVPGIDAAAIDARKARIVF